MNCFLMGDDLWKVVYVDPRSEELVDRTGALTVGCTHADTQTVYLANNLIPTFRVTVLIHELTHCALFSFGLLDQLHELVKPELWVPAEEWVCNLLADYGMEIYRSASKVLGKDALQLIPVKLSKLFA